MKGIISFSVEKAVTVFMVVIAVSIFGIVSFTRLTTDLFPSVNIPFAVVVTTYPGASPEEVESNVSGPLETVFQTTTNIKEVTSMSQENVSIIMLEFNPSANMDSAMIEMRESLNLVLDSLPEMAGNPIIIKLNPDLLPIMTFSVTYEGKDLQELTSWVNDELRPQVERVPGVASLTISGGYDSEIRILLDQDAIDDYNALIQERLDILAGNPMIDLPEDLEVKIDKSLIGAILMAQNFSFPAGFLRVDGLDYLVRVGDGLQSLEEIETLVLFDQPLLALPKLTLNDIADITFASANEQTYSKVNGEDALTITIQKGSGFATTDVTNAVNRVLNGFSDDDESINITMLLDQGEYINQSTSSVVNNLILGGILAIVILFIFLRDLRVTFIVGIAIPISLLFAIVLIYLSGITLNLVSLGGLALGIGMLVDNSIVVVENIFRMKKDGSTNKEAALYGTNQVAGAITASTLTTIGVFLPIMFIEDFIREIFYQLAMTITFSLLASLFIALTLVPSLANKVLSENEVTKKSERSTWLDGIKTTYEKLLRGALKFRVFVMIGALLLFIASIFLATSRGFEFFPASDEGALSISIEMDPDQPLNFEEFTETLNALYEDLRLFEDIETIGISLGGGMFSFGGASGDRASISIVLKDDRAMSTLEVRDNIVKLFEADYQTLVFEVSGTQGDVAFLVGSGIQIRLNGASLEQMREEALTIVDILDNIEGLRDIDPGFGRESRDIKVTVDKEEAIKLGVTVGQVLGAVAEFLQGPQSIGEVRVDSHSYQVYIYEEGDEKRTNIADIETLEALVIGVHPFTQNPISIADVATVTVQPGFSSITRINASRTLTISAEFETGYNATLVAAEVEEALKNYTPPAGYEYEILGENEEIMSALNTMILVGILAVLIVYMIMASQFQSLVYPFIIMVTIPLAFTGGFMILYLFGNPVSIVAVIGLIILSGVVVNNGIVLVDYINQVRDRGVELKEAIVEAGKVRLRPIFMTALTTILALSGMAVGLGQGAELIQPMALTAIGGLIYATFLTVFVVPIMYYAITLKGRYIVGVFFIIGASAIAVWMFILGALLYGGLALLVLIATPLIMLFYPKRVVEMHPQADTTDDTDFDTLIKRMLK